MKMGKIDFVHQLHTQHFSLKWKLTNCKLEFHSYTNIVHIFVSFSNTFDIFVETSDLVRCLCDGSFTCFTSVSHSICSEILCGVWLRIFWWFQIVLNEISSLFYCGSQWWFMWKHVFSFIPHCLSPQLKYFGSKYNNKK